MLNKQGDWSGWPAFALGLVLGALALTYGIASALSLPATPVLARLQEEGGPVPDPQHLTTLFRQSLALFPDSRNAAALALVAYAAARDGRADWRSAQTGLRESLCRRPLDSAGWARLAHVEQVLSAPNTSPAAGDYLARAITTGRFAPGFMQWRLILALELWPGLTPEQRALVVDQVGLLWRKNRSNLIKLARVAPIAARLECIMATYHPDNLEGFLRRRRSLRHTGEVEDRTCL